LTRKPKGALSKSLYFEGGKQVLPILKKKFGGKVFIVFSLDGEIVDCYLSAKVTFT
jgi:hypothetical protein